MGSVRHPAFLRGQNKALGEPSAGKKITKAVRETGASLRNGGPVQDVLLKPPNTTVLCDVRGVPRGLSGLPRDVSLLGQLYI